MATERQLAAARANGAKSRGPKTPEGKRISARNSRKHGLYDAPALPEPEAVAHFERLVASFTANLQPENPTETALIETMAAARVQHHRVIRMQESMLHDQILNKAATGPAKDSSHNSCNEPPACHLFFRHESRYSRRFDNAFDQLIKLKERTARLAARENLEFPAREILEQVQSTFRASTKPAPTDPISTNFLLRNEPDFNHPNPTPIIEVSNQIKDFRDR